MFSLYKFADMEQLLSEAQHRWLRPAEICEILQNHHKFHIASESPTRPASMLFLAEFLYSPSTTFRDCFFPVN